MSSRALFLRVATFVVLGLSSSLAAAATYYVATTGSDSSGDGSTSKPWGSIGFGTGRLASGDTLIVKAGTYSGIANFINSRRYAIANGTASAYTTIMAEQPGAVRIKNTGTLDYYDHFLFLESTKYVKVDGFIFDHSNSQYPPYTASITGTSTPSGRSRVSAAGEGSVSSTGSAASATEGSSGVTSFAAISACRLFLELMPPVSALSPTLATLKTS